MSALFVHVYCILYLQQLKIHILHPINNPKLLIFSKSIPFCKHYKKKAALQQEDGKVAEIMELFVNLPADKQQEALSYLRYLSASADK